MEALYRILLLKPNATEAEVKQSYRKLVMRYHPDRNPSPEAHQRFLEIQNAYDILCDADLMAAYRAQQTATHTVSDDPVPHDQGNKYKHSSSRRIQKEDFDPINYVPSYMKSYVTTDDADYYCFMRVFLLGLVGAALTGAIYGIANMLYPLEPVPTCLVLSFLLFDLTLCWDLGQPARYFHTFIVKITEDTNKGLYALYLSIDEAVLRNVSVEKIRASNRYRNFFYAKSLSFDYEKYVNLALQKSVIMNVCIGLFAYNKYEEIDLGYFSHRKKQILKHCQVMIAIGIVLLPLQFIKQLYPLYFLFFFYHFYFIGKYLMSNRLD